METEFNFLFDLFFRNSISLQQLSGLEKAQSIIAFFLVVASFLCFVFGVVAPLCKMVCTKNHTIPKRKLLLRWGICVFLGGCFIYMVGFCTNGTAKSIMASLIRPAISSLELFAFHSDLLEVAEECHSSRCYMTLFSIIYASAFIISTIVVINCLGSRTKFRLRFWHYRLIHRDTYNVFFQDNDRSLFLAENIGAMRSSGTIVVDNQVKDSTNHGHSSLSQIFGLHSYDSETVSRIEKFKGILISSFSLVSDDKSSSPYVLENNGLSKLAKLLKHANNVNLFFMAGDEYSNIRGAINVLKSHALQKGSKNIHVYCKARRNYENIALEFAGSNCEIHLLDDALLSIYDLKDKKSISHPANFVEFDRLGKTSSTFTCMMVGFGQTGQDAFRFFYEFSAFVGTDGEKAPVKFRIFDKRMTELMGGIVSEIPAIDVKQISENKYQGLIEHDDIVFESIDTGSANFWMELSDNNFINSVNCIVIALGNDEDNMAVASQLYEFALRKRPSMDNLKIFVRSYERTYEYKLNLLCQSYAKENNVLVSFGELSKMYSKDKIFGGELEKLAEIYHSTYAKVAGLNNDDLRKVHNEKIHGSLLDRVELAIVESQNLSNALHISTKLKMIGSVEFNQLPKAFPFDITSEELEDMTVSDIDNMPVEKRSIAELYVRLYNASKCEHLRWNAAHEMMGFIRCGTDKNCRRRHHPCISGWNERDNGTPILDNVTKSYDYYVVLTSLTIHNIQATN